MILDKEHLRANLDEVIWNIEQARIEVSEHHIVKLVTVAKYTELENISTLYELGQRAFGENQVQQLKERMEALDALGDIDYVMNGTVLELGMGKVFDLACNEIHRSNMSKVCKTKEEAIRTVKYRKETRNEECDYRYNQQIEGHIVLIRTNIDQSTTLKL